MRQSVGSPLLDCFAALKDWRQAGKALYPLPEILLLLLSATLAGADDCVEIELWGKEQLAILRRSLPYQHGIPSHNTVTGVLAALDPALFKACFVSWVEGLREAEPDLIPIDGKTSRRSHARRNGREPLHLVSAPPRPPRRGLLTSAPSELDGPPPGGSWPHLLWRSDRSPPGHRLASRQRLVLGQEAVSGKSNEITAIPPLLERLALKGALVTIDAVGTQTGIARTILERGGDYLLALKANRPATFEDVEAFFADPPPSVLDTCETIDGEPWCPCFSTRNIHELGRLHRARQPGAQAR